MVMHAELECVICSGPRRGKQFTYALLAERAPRARRLARDEALAELARRFVRSRGPATAHDLAKWSSLTLADARAGIELAKSHFVSETVNGQTAWFPDVTPPPAVRAPRGLLLSNYDEYVCGYADTSAYGDPAHFNRLDTSTLYSYLHYLVVNGKLVGLWKRGLGPKLVTVEPLLFGPLSPAHQRALLKATEPYSAFLGVPVKLDFGAARVGPV